MFRNVNVSNLESVSQRNLRTDKTEWEEKRNAFDFIENL